MRNVGEFVQIKFPSSDDITGRDCCYGNKLSRQRPASSIVLLWSEGALPRPGIYFLREEAGG